MISWLVCVFCFIPFCSGFLLDTNQQGQSGNLMNEDRYDALLKLFMDERKARLQLQNYVIKQQQKIDVLISLPDRMEKIENATNTITYFHNFENSSASISLKYNQLERMYETLEQRQNQLEIKLKASENRTLQLEGKLSRLKQVTAINQLQNLANLQQEVESVKHNINSITVTSQARGQDMISMYQDLTGNTHKLASLENDQKQMNDNISTLEKTLKDNMTIFESNVYQNMSQTIGSALVNQNFMVQSQLQEINERNTHVGLTAAGTSNRGISSGQIIMFPVIKSYFGIKDLSNFKRSGKFTCEKSGIYLVSITLMVCASSNAVYDVYHNDVSLMQYYASGTTCNSGSGTLFIRLNNNDKVYIKAHTSITTVFYNWSSLSILKVG